ncbi:MAG TPA: AMP-binding protein [Thermoanaerobaculia bacterium]
MKPSVRVGRFFDELEGRRGGPALIFEGKSYSFGDLDDLSRRYAGGLAAMGIQPGDRIAVLTDPCPEAVIALLGHYRLGALHVPVNTRYRAAEIAHILRDSGARAILTQAGSAADDEAARLPQTEPPRHRIVIDPSGASPPSGDVRFDRLLEWEPLRGARPRDADTAMLIYTSGTTGPSKGVALSFQAIFDNTLAVTNLWRFSSDDRVAIALPLFHVHGLCLGVHGALLHGSTMLLYEKFDARRIVECFARDGATVFQGVPTMYVRLLEELARSPEAGSMLSGGRLFTAGSAALSAEDFATFEAATGHRILERYGMSETLFTFSNLYEDRRPGTVGIPVPGCDARVVDDGGREAGEGEPGELLVRSNGMMTGYWNRAAETSASFRGGWFATGDVVRRGPDSFLTVVGRKSIDFIKSGGFKISSREIEDVLLRHEAVKEVAVIGVPDRVWGERVVAAVVLNPGARAASEAEVLRDLSAFCSRFLADYKRPREVRLCEELPRNAMGKVQKHEIRKSIG